MKDFCKLRQNKHKLMQAVFTVLKLLNASVERFKLDTEKFPTHHFLKRSSTVGESCRAEREWGANTNFGLLSELEVSEASSLLEEASATLGVELTTSSMEGVEVVLGRPLEELLTMLLSVAVFTST